MCRDGQSSPAAYFAAESYNEAGSIEKSIAVLRKGAAEFLGNGKRGRGKMLYKLGRLLQMIGLILLPIAIAGNLSPVRTLDLRQSLTLSGIGVAVFTMGYLIQQAGKK